MRAVISKDKLRNQGRYVLIEYSGKDKVATLKRQSDNLEIEVEMVNQNFHDEFEKMAKINEDRAFQKKPPPVWQADIRESGKFLKMSEVGNEQS
ncbi:MAG: hypothetical protein RL641_284 [Candidatus Parcubacteria bacterium]|jgi:predicted peptidase